MSDIPHLPWFIRSRPLDDGQAVIENGTYEGANIAVCEWHIAEYIVDALNRRHAESPSVAEAVATEREALDAVIAATNAYLPPDGISMPDCLNRILEATDNPRIVAAIRARKEG